MAHPKQQVAIAIEKILKKEFKKGRSETPSFFWFAFYGY
jgi:hypothetical protein